MEWFRKAANQGHAEAQYYLGCCYRDGRGVAQDDDQAARWYFKAAEQGLADAHRELNNYRAEKRTPTAAGRNTCEVTCPYCGRKKTIPKSFIGLYSRCACGKSFPTDAYSKRWFRKAAEQENATAQYHLGCCYRDGKGVAQDREKAAEWFRKAAEQGHAAAQYEFGLCCESGKGVAKDQNQAREWFKKAAGNGCKEAQDALQKSGGGCAGSVLLALGFLLLGVLWSMV